MSSNFFVSIKNSYFRFVWPIICFLSWLVRSVGCFVCTSFNHSNPDCEDPFVNRDNRFYHKKCWSSHKRRTGVFPATQCIKMVATDCTYYNILFLGCFFCFVFLFFAFLSICVCYHWTLLFRNFDLYKDNLDWQKGKLVKSQRKLDLTDIYLSIYQSVCMYICMYLYLSQTHLNLSIYLSIYLPPQNQTVHTDTWTDQRQNKKTRSVWPI